MFEWWFKYPRALYEQGRLTWSPEPGASELWLLLALALLLVAASIALPRRMRALGPARAAVIGLLQAAFVAAVGVLLARPTLEITTLTPGANTIAVLLDTSRSMAFPEDGDSSQGDLDEGRSRMQAARAALDETLLPELARLGDVVTFTFGESARRESLAQATAAAPRTRLLESVEDVLTSFRGVPLAALVVVSDGADNGDAPDPGGLAAAGVPVHTVGVGPATMPGEAQITDVSLAGTAPPDSRVVARMTVQHASSGPAVIKVRDGERLIARHDVTLLADTPAQRLTMGFDSGPGGIRELTFELEPPPGDVLAENNRLERLLTVRERSHRVLYLEGEPRWEYKFLRRALSGDGAVALTSWLRTTERKTYRQDVQSAAELETGFPATMEELYGYDVIVLGSLAATYLEPRQHGWLESFVGERGGSLLALAGRDALAEGGWDVTPLADVLPVHIERHAQPTYGPWEGLVRPTREGQVSPVTQLVHGEGGDPWATLPPLADHQRLGSLKPAATTLLEVVNGGDTRPLLVMQPYGLGNAAVLASATTWRWHMRTPADDERHTLFWRQLVRQLGESAQQPRELDLEVREDVLTLRLTERDASFAPRSDVHATATVTGPRSDALDVALAPTDLPGRLAARFHAPQPGVYRVDVRVDGSDEVVTRFVRLGAQSLEYFQPARNEALLQRLASATGGRYWEPDSVAGLAQALNLTSAGVRHREWLPLWDMPLAFIVLLVLKGGEWLLRRRWGRV